jgi:hypothetical protein
MTIDEIKEVVGRISYKDWQFIVAAKGETIYLQIGFNDRDAYTGDETLQKGRKWLPSPHMTKSEIVQTAMKAVLTAEEHEARENFKYRGSRIFQPHFDVDALAEVARGRKLDYRKASA